MKEQGKLPIGVFDSGIGGLTVVKAMKQLMPHEQFLYFGDTAHMPYGDKSAEAIKNYSLNIAQFLYDKGIKCLVIACNSASASAGKEVEKAFEGKISVINVIDPVVDYLSTSNYKTVGLIGTKRTVDSGIYLRKLKKKAPKLKLKSKATPLLAPMIEEGFFNNKISRTIIHSYLDSPQLKSIEALILACTHYPLIEEEVRQYYKGKTEIVNSARIVAQTVKTNLDALALLQEKKSKHNDFFFVSDFTQSFEKTAPLFLGEHIHLEKANVFE